MKKNLLYALLTICLGSALLLSGCGLIQPTTEATPLPPVTSNGKISAEGRVVPRDSAVLAFPIAGEVESISISKGSDVKAGDVLVQLGRTEQAQATITTAKLEQIVAQQAVDKLARLAEVARSQAQQGLATAEKALIEAQKAYDDLDTQVFQDELDTKTIDMQTAKDDLDNAQKEFDKYKDLDPDNATRKNAETVLDNAKADYQQAVYDHDLLQNRLDQATAALNLAKANVAEARRAYEARADGPDAEEHALAQARLENADAQLKAAEKALENYTLIAPFDGRVIEDKSLFVGEWLSPYQSTIVLADLSNWYVETKDLNELDVVNIKIGQKVEIIPDAMNDLVLNGSVEWIDETYTEKSGDVVYTVRIKLDEADSSLRWGMTVQINFIKE
jgi:multidrug resistance efflux pump